MLKPSRAEIARIQKEVRRLSKVLADPEHARHPRKLATLRRNLTLLVGGMQTGWLGTYGGYHQGALDFVEENLRLMSGNMARAVRKHLYGFWDSARKIHKTRPSSNLRLTRGES